jgi:hypothetical protein
VSEREHDQPVESRSKVKLVRNAKGDTQIELSIVAGESAEEARRIRDLAVELYQETHRTFYPGRVA